MRFHGLWSLFLVAGLLTAGSAHAQADNIFARADAYRAERAAACRSGDLDACAQEGQNFWAGVRVPRDLPKAVEFLGRACRGGRLASCAHLGRLHAEAGTPFHQPATASGLFERACAGGEIEGCTAGAAALRRALQHAAVQPAGERGPGVDAQPVKLARGLDLHLHHAVE